MLVFRTVVLLFVASGALGAPLPEVHLQPRGPALRLAVTGDTGKGTEAVARGIGRVHAATPIDAIVLTGDTFYPCGVTSETDSRWSLVTPLTRIAIPIFPVLGNHDFCGESDPDAQIRASGPVPNWRFPARQYVLKSPAADFAFVDTTQYAKGRPNNVSPTIQEAFAQSTTPWRVVVGHHPVISSGYHGYFPREEVSRMRELIPLLREEKVDFFIGGHDHHMELIRGRMLHLISGAGSSPIPALKLRMTTVFPSEIRRERIGFAIVEITERRIRVRFYDAGGKPVSEWIPGRTQ